MTNDAATTPTDEPVKKWDPKTDPNGYTRNDVVPKDWFLDVVLNFTVSTHDTEPDGYIALTVISGGAVVSGTAISRAAWIAGVLDQYTQGGGDPTWMKKAFDELHGSDVAAAERRKDANLPYAAREFLHMKDVRIGTATDPIIAFPLWRGALSDITGWSLGAWNPGTSA